MTRAKLLSGAAAMAMTLVAAGIGSGASAADFEPAPDVWSWDGFYMGVHVGGLWSNRDEEDCDRNNISDIVGDDDETIDQLGVVDIFGPGALAAYDNYCRAKKDGNAFNANIADLDSPNAGSRVNVLNLDGDFIAFINGEHGDGDDDSGFIGGGQIGINRQYGTFVVGLEADIAGVFDGHDSYDSTRFEYFESTSANGKNLQQYEGTGRVRGSDELDWLATFRGRLGMTFGEEGRLLGYITGGGAVVRVDSDSSASFNSAGARGWCDVCAFGDQDDPGAFYQVGATVGGGFEYAWWDNVTLGLQYLYVNLADEERETEVTFHGDDGRRFEISRTNGFEDLHVVTARLNWLFN